MSESKQKQREGPINHDNSIHNDLQATLVGETKKKQKVDQPLLCFCIVNYLLNMAVSMITPFYPPLAKDAGLSVAFISYVFSINPVGSFIFSLLIGPKMSQWGRKKCMIIGLIVQIITIIAFGLLELLQDDFALFLTLSLVIRFFQGMSRASYSAISFAYVPILWPNSIQQKISIMESLTGLGLMSGPFIGAALYHFFGYQVLFYVVGGLFSLSLIPTFLALPEDNQEFKKTITLNPKVIYGDRNILLLALVVTMTSAGTCFINPMFSIHMGTYQIQEESASLLIGALTVSYIVFINFVPLLCRKYDKKIILTVGVLLSGIGDLIIAPTNGLPNEWYMVLVGLPIIGIANALCVLPSIPQFIDYMCQLYPQPEHRRSITDISSALFVSTYSFGILVGPLLGGQVYQWTLQSDDSLENQQRAFMWSATVMASIQFLVAVLFFFFAGGFKTLFAGQKIGRDKLLHTNTSDPTRSLYTNKVYSDNDNSEVSAVGETLTEHQDVKMKSRADTIEDN